MYRSFFGLRLLPFGASPDPRFLFLRPQIKETLACLQYGITARKGFVVLTGEVGTGKTTLLKSALNTFDTGRITTAFVFNPRLEVLDFFEFLLTDFGIPPATRTKSAMLLQLNSWLIERYRAQQLCAIVIDEAQNLSWELLEEIRLLTNLETSSEKLVQIILSGQPELEEKLYHPSLRQLRQRIALWCRTQPLTVEETLAYVEERLSIAGATSQVFLPEATELIYHYSKGIPRIINHLCEHTLIYAYAEQVKPIPAHIVESVGLELDLVQHPFTISFSAMQALMKRSLQPNMLDTFTPAADGEDSFKEREI
ncbi:MAG TPA: AAA family ATPase [Terracidiphilus sp.]|jgi:type II secretory pathway predicted ATPase ExeA